MLKIKSEDTEVLSTVKSPNQAVGQCTFVLSQHSVLHTANSLLFTSHRLTALYITCCPLITVSIMHGESDVSYLLEPLFSTQLSLKSVESFSAFWPRPTAAQSYNFTNLLQPATSHPAAFYTLQRIVLNISTHFHLDGSALHAEVYTLGYGTYGIKNREIVKHVQVWQ